VQQRSLVYPQKRSSIGTTDIAREIMRRLDLAGDELPTALEEFVERHLGPERQLTLRLA
jgi:hypothetical protein